MMEQAWRDEFQADWWSSEPASWVPGLPVCVSTEMSCFQTLAQPSSSCSGGQLQLVDQYAAAAATPCNYESPIRVFEKSARGFGDDIAMTKMKMHRCPESMVALGQRYTVPLRVAIGPYHHYVGRLKPAEKAKHLAAYLCIKASRRSVQELYDEYMVWCTYEDDDDGDDEEDGDDDDDDGMMDPWLHNFFESKTLDINNDILLLENQLPWLVLDTMVKLVSPRLVKKFIPKIREMLQTAEVFGSQHFEWDSSIYAPPHLLGLYRYHMVNGSEKYEPISSFDFVKVPDEVPISVTAIDLAEMAMKLKPSETEGYMDLHITRGLIHGKLYLPPVHLDETTAARLVSMAAFELCTNSDFFDRENGAFYENSGVCSYLLLLAMFVEGEEDVKELRRIRLLRPGVGVGLTNKEALHFFTTLGKHLIEGPSYWDVMFAISQYKEKKGPWVRAHKFFFKNRAKILTAFTTIAGFIGLLGTLMSLKKG